MDCLWSGCDQGPVRQWSVTGALNASSGDGALCLDGVTFSGNPWFHPGTGMGRRNLLGFPSHQLPEPQVAAHHKLLPLRLSPLSPGASL